MRCEVRASRWTAGAALLALLCAAPALGDDGASRVQRLNGAFLKHLSALASEVPIAVATIREGWPKYRSEAPESFVADALAILSSDYRDALEAFDRADFAAAAAGFDKLRGSQDPFLAANSVYFYARSLIERSRLEEAEQFLATVLNDRAIEAHTAYAPHLWFMRGFCEARNLRYDAAAQSLQALRTRFDDAPEPVQVGSRQLLLELDRRQAGTLDEVASVMDYVGDRLDASDSGQRVRDRQEEILRLLDKLIEDQQKQEQQSGGGSSGENKGGGKDSQKRMNPKRPDKPADQSQLGEGGDGKRDLHTAPKAQPGEMWGKLPDAEREKILQSIRERYPSRYRQLVEQFYRSLAEDK